jgi:hypothetical protein
LLQAGLAHRPKIINTVVENPKRLPNTKNYILEDNHFN